MSMAAQFFFSSLIRRSQPTARFFSSPKAIAAPIVAQFSTKAIYDMLSSSHRLSHHRPEPNAAPMASLRSRLASDRPLFGLLLLSDRYFSPLSVYDRVLLNFDYVMVDLYYGARARVLFGNIHSMLALISLERIPSIIRLPKFWRSMATEALDLGAQGFVFPGIRSAKDAEMAVSYCRCCPGSAEAMVICQVAAEAGLDSIEGIARVDGVGCIQIGGPSAFKWSLYPARMREKMMEAERRVAKEKERRASWGGGLYMAGTVTTHDGPGQLTKRGYDMVARTIDPHIGRGNWWMYG